MSGAHDDPCQSSGEFVGRVTPVPIPNTEVKPAGADGTARVTVWESRKSPGLFLRFQISNLRAHKSPLDLFQAGFCFFRYAISPMGAQLGMHRHLVNC